MNFAPGRIWLTTTESGQVDDFTMWVDSLQHLPSEAPKTEYVRADIHQAALAEARAERDAAVAAAYDAASLVPMDRLAAGESIAPANLGAAIQRLATDAQRDALAAMLAEAREEGRREALGILDARKRRISDFMLRPESNLQLCLAKLGLLDDIRAALTGEDGE